MKITFEDVTTPSGNIATKVIAAGRPRGWIHYFNDGWGWGYRVDSSPDGWYWFMGIGMPRDRVISALLGVRPRYRERKGTS